jgi:glutamate-1-semialdehyde 2,1-aminomutase
MEGILETYRRTHPGSRALWERACRSIPGGITHDIRQLTPFPLYVTHAQGSRKWDVDGREYVDYWMGHGALFLGHAYPPVVQAVQAQMARGTHYGACHELEIRWAELVQAMIPSAERVRFTMSGTEATHLALRLARASTGRPKVVKFTGHFHGWHDGLVAGVHPPYDLPLSSGVPEATLGEILLAPPNDLKALETVLAGRDDVAALILEPAGGLAGTFPTVPAFLKELRALTQERGVVLIFDEVISGFRYAPGGAQAYFGVTPDLTALAKILAGGLPGGAVAGQAAIMDVLAFRDDPRWNRTKKVAHAGTFNANPLSAAAGIACLEALADGRLHRQANQTGEALRAALSTVWKRSGAPGGVYGDVSLLHVSLEDPIPPTPAQVAARSEDQALLNRFRCALLNHGVDMPRHHAWLSAFHTEADLQLTQRAVEQALGDLAAEGAFRGSKRP